MIATSRLRLSLRALALAVPLAIAPVLTGCSSHPPAQWARGGAPLGLGRARWERGGDTVDLLPDGKVLVDGDHVWTLDAAGRVYTSDRDPVALLSPDGHLVGNDERSLGFVGVASASPPGSSTAWVTIAPTGQVVLYDEDGASRGGGAWSGCDGATFRTCTLVSHLVVSRDVARRPRVGVGIGVGIGVFRLSAHGRDRVIDDPSDGLG